ncbi:MAG: hypothetical protein PHP32_05230 [Candidatus Izemoplasmatales bacterium]|nr:hypothetical protein [Candidatus Izemoplasmatales bacterium]
MNIGFIYYSETGHTLSVLEQLKNALEKEGRNVRMVPLLCDNTKGVRHLGNRPDIAEFDFVVIASPVQAFQLCQVMKEYLKVAFSTHQFKYALLVTQQLKNAFWGGNSAIRRMRKDIDAMGGLCMAETIVHWGAYDRDAQAKEAIEAIVDAIHEQE